MIKEWVDSHRPIRSLACPARFERATWALKKSWFFDATHQQKKSSWVRELSWD